MRLVKLDGNKLVVVEKNYMKGEGKTDVIAEFEEKVNLLLINVFVGKSKFIGCAKGEFYFHRHLFKKIAVESVNSGVVVVNLYLKRP